MSLGINIRTRARILRWRFSWFLLKSLLEKVTVTHKSALCTQGALNFKGLKGLNSLAQSRAQGRQPHSGTLGRKDIVSFLRTAPPVLMRFGNDSDPGRR